MSLQIVGLIYGFINKNSLTFTNRVPNADARAHIHRKAS
jgi:hypothetical protein